MKIILLCKPEFFSAIKTSVFIKNTKNNHSSASEWWEYSKYCFKENVKIFSKISTTQDLVLKRMLELFVTVPPIKKILQFQKSISFFSLKTQKKQSIQQMLDGEAANLVLKRMLELIHHSRNYNFKTKKNYEICSKRKFRTKN